MLVVGVGNGSVAVIIAGGVGAFKCVIFSSCWTVTTIVLLVVDLTVVAVVVSGVGVGATFWCGLYRGSRL